MINTQELQDRIEEIQDNSLKWVIQQLIQENHMLRETVVKLANALHEEQMG